MHSAEASEELKLLHISDLHMSSLEQAENAASQLVADLRRELRLEALSAIVVTGDVTERATAAEFDAAEVFLSSIMSAMDVGAESLLVVPGNHDVDWQASRRAYQVVRRDEAPSSSLSSFQVAVDSPYVEIVGEGDYDEYAARFENFARFYKNVSGRDFGLRYEDQQDLIVLGNGSVVILGLNSAWESDHFFPSRNSINSVALSRGLAAADSVRDRASGREPVFIAAWHHSITGPDGLADSGFVQRLVVGGFALALHGHVHRHNISDYHFEWTSRGRSLFFLGAGTLSSADPDRGAPWHYSLLSVRSDRVTIRSRGKEEFGGSWRPLANFHGPAGTPPSDRLTLRLRAGGEISERLVPTGPIDLGTPSVVRSIGELRQALSALHFEATGYRIAVEAWLFDSNGRLLIQRRGLACRDEVGKLECVGGQVEGVDLIANLRRWVRARVGDDVECSVDQLLDIQPTRHVERQGPEDWIVVSYLCRLIGGEIRVVDGSKTAELIWVDLASLHLIADEELSRSTSRARDVYRARFRSIPYFSEL